MKAEFTYTYINQEEKGNLIFFILGGLFQYKIDYKDLKEIFLEEFNNDKGIFSKKTGKLKNRVECSKCNVLLEIGIENPIYTALLYGMLCAFFPIMIEYFKQWVDIRQHKASIYANFQRPLTYTEINLEFEIKSPSILYYFIKKGKRNHESTTD